MKEITTKLSSGLHAILWNEGSWYVAKCVEVEIASQGKTKKEALANLSEALSLYFSDEALPKTPRFPEIEFHSVQFSYA
ncbi:MAG: type II toxin-antitoxin system HicB family antitoxin [Patescibacteria group bacterium]